MRARITFLLVALILYGLGSIAPASSAPTPGSPVRFTLESETVAVGERPKVIFDRPLPAVGGERYWITFTGAGESDGAWGQWQYVDNGTREVQLKAAKSPGRFEVRLHDGYPRVQYNIVQRVAMTVVPEGGPPPASATASSSRASSSRVIVRKKTDDTLRGRRVTWKGKAGDADDPFFPDGWKLPDIVSVDAEGRAGELTVTFTFAHDLEQVLGQRKKNGAMHGYMLAEVYFDTDGDASTGPSPDMASNRGGFDVRLQVSTGLELESDGMTFSQFGSVESLPAHHRALGFATTYHIDDRTGHALAPTETTWRDDKELDIRGRKLVVRVPYQRLGLRAGRTVRMCFLDLTMNVIADDKVSADALLTLK